MDAKTYQKIYRDFNQYKADMFLKLDINFTEGSSLIDVGAGDCTDALIFKHVFGLDVFLTDIYESPNVSKHKLPFTKMGIHDLPMLNRKFDFVFVHDVLHHVDEKNQDRECHVSALNALKSVINPGGTLIVIEGNRYNPLFYPHMVKMLGHEHFTQKYFKDIVLSVFSNAEFKAFEAHYYPPKLLTIFKVYETLMEKFSPKAFLAYNTAIIRKI